MAFRSRSAIILAVAIWAMGLVLGPLALAASSRNVDQLAAADPDEPHPTQPYAQYRLAELYDQDDSVPGNEERAMLWFERAAMQGWPAAQDELGDHYLRGHGAPRDRARALYWFRKAAAQDDGPEQAKLAKLLEQAGHCLPWDCLEAAAWRRKAAAEYRARSTDPDAQRELATVLYRDGRCRGQDCTEAAYWFGEAARHQPLYSARMLGEMYSRGIGVAHDDAQALAWYLKEADIVAGPSAVAAANIYTHSRQVPHDLAKAYFWLDVAAERSVVGNSPPTRAAAKRGRDAIARKLNAEQIAAVEAEAQKWIDGHTLKPPPEVSALLPRRAAHPAGA